MPTPFRLAPIVALVACPLALHAAPSGPAPAAEVRAVVAQVLEAYGGPAALQKVRGYRLEGTLFNLRRHDESPTIRVFQRPDRLKVLIGYEGAYEVRIVDRARGWRNESGGPVEPADGVMLDAMVLQAARAGVPWILSEHESDARWVSEPDERELLVDSVRAIGIEIPIGEGLLFRAYVDPHTHRVLVSQGLLTGPGFRTRFETWYSDFREVEGVRFAFREVNWASGVRTGITTVKAVRLNPKFGPGEFAPPGEATPKPGARQGDS